MNQNFETDTNSFSALWQQGLDIAVSHFPDNKIKQREFAACFVYLITGGFAGSPTIREHLVSYSVGLQGDGVKEEDFPLFHADTRFKMAGSFLPDEATEFILPILKADLSQAGKLRDLALTIWNNEYCFDHDPDDLLQLGVEAQQH